MPPALGTVKPCGSEGPRRRLLSGPCRVSSWCLNCGGAEVAWRALEEAAQSDVVMATLQEVKLGAEDYTAFAVRAAKLGYATFEVIRAQCDR